jgi:hypothetical protein
MLPGAGRVGQEHDRGLQPCRNDGIRLQFRRNQPPAAVRSGLGRGLASPGTPFSLVFLQRWPPGGVTRLG